MYPPPAGFSLFFLFFLCKTFAGNTYTFFLYGPTSFVSFKVGNLNLSVSSTKAIVVQALHLHTIKKDSWELVVFVAEW